MEWLFHIHDKCYFKHNYYYCIYSTVFKPVKLSITPTKPSGKYLICTFLRPLIYSFVIVRTQLQLLLLVSNLDWFWSSKHHNNCSHISRWTLSGLKTLSFTWFSINHVLDSNLIFRIFWEAFVTFTVPLRRNDLHLTSSEERLSLHLSISIALYVWIIYHIIGDIDWWNWYIDHFMSVPAAMLERSHWFTLQAS